jgi:hypothetical protein
MKPSASVPLGDPGRLLREFAQQLVVLGHDLFRNRHLRLKLPAAWEELDASRTFSTSPMPTPSLAMSASGNVMPAEVPNDVILSFVIVISQS